MHLFEARARKRFTQWDVRLATGIHQSKISLFENGYLIPNGREKRAIAEALDLQVNDISWTQEGMKGAAR